MKNGPILKTRNVFAALALLSGMSALAQSPAKIAGLTPNELSNGTAKLVGHSNPNQTLRLVFGLERPHAAEEEQFLEELGTKGSPNFQHFLSADEWNKRFAPSAQDEQAVVDWATSEGLSVTRRFSNRLLVDVEAPIATVEKVLGVTFNDYQMGIKTVFSNDRDPVIPTAITRLIHSIGGMNNIQNLRPASKTAVEPQFDDYVAGPVNAQGANGGGSATAKRPATQSGPIANITGGAYDPTDLYSSQAYDVNGLDNLGHCCNPKHNSGVTPPSSSIAIATAGRQNGSDFAGFQAQYPYLAYHYQEYYIDGTPACCDGEGTLDFEWSTAMANSFGSYVDTAMVYLYDGVNANFSTFTDVYNQILTDGKARVFSTSWGCEELACTPSSVMDTDHGIFNSMIGQGWTLVAASGDQGATGGCSSTLAVQYPASDPNIVGAGGTRLSLYSNGVFNYESAWTGGPSGCGANDGGSTGGVSAYYAAPSYQTPLGFSKRVVPDVALNADWYYTPQNMYFNGSLGGNGGTSIVAPEVAGFFAQTNAYLDYVATVNGGCYGGTTCSPIGNGNWYLYYFGEHAYAPHYPFYDITSGCNNNDVTAYYGLGYYCAGTGYDAVTGWGSFNFLQLSWAINAYRAGDFGAPSAAISSSATTGVWYNTDQWVQWTLTDTSGDGLAAVGVSGFSQSWDAAPSDHYSLSRPSSADGFFTGPQHPNTTYGYQYVSGAGQGCHTAYVRGYDNSGSTGLQSYGPVCYDTVPPITTDSLAGTLSGSVYTSTVKMTLSATDASSGVGSTYYKLDGGAYTTYSAPVVVSTIGAHTVYIYSRDHAGNTETAHSFAFTITSPNSSAQYTGLDTATQGTWTGKYGANGHVIPNDANLPPAYATVSLAGSTAYTWAASTSDVRALQTASGATTRIASTYYSATNFTIGVNLTDGATHRVALYLLDWDTTARTETISVRDATSNVVLDTENYSSFHNGQYAAWNLKGNVLIQVTKTGGANAVVAGLFFDPVVTPATATYVGADTTTQGTWTGHYGSAGKLIANDVTNPPAYATVALTGDTAYTWAASTSDARALQTSSGSSTRIASTYYAATSYVIDVNITDGASHKVSLYQLDWDTTARAQTVTITDAISNAVLNTQSYSSFHNGEYAAWKVTGHVKIQVTHTAGANAVVSGIFFD